LKVFALDKYLKQGVEYTTPVNIAYVIRKIGTNSSTGAKLNINGVDLGVIDSDVAPLHKTSSNLLGPLDLEDLYYVIPPKTKFKVEGASGDIIRILGEILVLDYGEKLPEPHVSRFEAQGKAYKTLLSGSYSHGTDVAWAAGDENEVLSLTPLTTEKYVLDGFIGAKVEGDTVNEGDFALTFYLDNIPLELDVAENLGIGVDVKSMPLPPADASEEIPFTLKNFPLEVLGDHTLSIRCINISGASKSPASGSSWTVTVKAIARYFKG